MSYKRATSLLVTNFRFRSSCIIVLCITIGINFAEAQSKGIQSQNLESTFQQIGDEDYEPPTSFDVPAAECLTHEDCPELQSCFVDFKCRDPCLNTKYGYDCGPNSCQVVQHRPQCLGGQFRPTPPTQTLPTLPPSENIELGDDPGKCVYHSQCPDHLVCFVDGICRDSCTQTQHNLRCGLNAACKIVKHELTCACLDGYLGNPLVQCTSYKDTTPRPLPPRTTTPLPERIEEGTCISHNDCPDFLSCYMDNKCRDSCNSEYGLQCGEGLVCQVSNHQPRCRALGTTKG